MAFTFSSSTPYSYLSAENNGSFAYRTVKDRMPVIITKVIDFLCQNKKNLEVSCAEEQAAEDLKLVIGKLSKLRSEMQTNKPLLPLESPSSHLGDCERWNKHITKEVQRWFNSPWLLVECYMYRAIYAAFENSTHLKEIDPFSHLKKEAFIAQKNTIFQLATYTNDKCLPSTLINDEIEIHFTKLLKHCLWGNRNDLSISAGNTEIKLSAICDDIEKLNSHILVNESNQVWLHVNQLKNEGAGKKDLRIIMDNCGLEIVTDLCFAVYCLSHKLFDRVYFYVKKIPWFVSDVTLKDFHWTLQEMKQSGNSDSTDLEKLADKCLSYLNSQQFLIVEESFWTLPLPYHVMEEEDSKLYNDLSHSQLIVFKGDLNYRKLGGDINWPFDTNFPIFLRGFQPAPLVALRTIKAEIVCNIPLSKVGELETVDKDWMTTGDYGLIQFAK